MTSLRETLRNWWLAITGQQAPKPVSKPVSPEVILHDPDAQRPHDLDDPFFDPKVQSRMGSVIAKNATPKK